MARRLFIFALVLMLSMIAAAASAEVTDSDFQTTVLSDGSVAITKYTGKDANVQIPETIRGFRVSAIHSAAFAKSPLEKVRIPDCVTSVAGDAFAGCKGEKKLQIMLDSHPVYATIDGSLYDKRTRTLVIGLGSDLVVPDGIVAIGDYACYGKNYQSITLPATVTRIGDRAFSGASCASYPLGSGVTHIGEGAFAYFRAQNRDLVFPESVVYIGNEAFQGAELSSLSLNSRLETIGASAFGSSKWYINQSYVSSSYHTGDCQAKLKTAKVIDVVIPAGVTLIGEKAFAYMTYKSVSADYTCTCVRGTKYDMSKNTSSVLDRFGGSSSSDTKVVTENTLCIVYEAGCPAAGNIQAKTFANSQVMIRINGANGQPVSLSVGEKAFTDATVFFEPSGAVRITGLGASAFEGAVIGSPTEFVLSDSVAAIAKKAFDGHGHLVKEIPASVIEIGDEALYSNQPTGTEIYLHAGLKAIGQKAFNPNQCFAVEAGSYAEQWAKDSFAAYSVLNAAAQEDDLSWLTGPMEAEPTAAPAPQKLSYEEAGPFCEGYAVVRRDGKYGYIDITGKEVIPCTYAYAYDISEGIGLVFHDREEFEQYGYTYFTCSNAQYIHMASGEVWPQVWRSAVPFSEGLARVWVGDKCGFINTDNEIAIDIRLDAAGGFVEGRASYGIKDADGMLYGFIDSKGNEVIPAVYTAMLTNFAEGAAHVMDGDRSLVIGRNGEVLFETDSESAVEFSQGIAVVEKNGMYGFVNKQGKLVSPMIWEAKSYVEAPRFSNDRAPVLDPVSKYYGYIDTHGEMVIAPQFVDAGNFENGYALVWGWPTSKLIDTEGNTVLKLPEDYNLDCVYENGLIGVYCYETVDDNYIYSYGFMNDQGAILAEPVYDSAYYGDGYMTLLKDGVLTILNSEGYLIY